MTEGYPSYYSITPATVRYDYRLKPYERLLFGKLQHYQTLKGTVIRLINILLTYITSQFLQFLSGLTI